MGYFGLKQEIMERSNGDVIPVLTNVDIWLTVKDVANILKLSEATVKNRCAKGEYQTRKIVNFSGNGGNTYLILFSSLPQDVVSQFTFYGQLSRV